MFSEEIKAYTKFGYNFEVLKGYTFGKEIVFKDYVDSLYLLKNESINGSPMYKISKLLLNSLYGKMGVNLDKNEIKVIKSVDISDILQDNNLWDLIDLQNGNSIVVFTPKVLDYEEDNYKGPDANVAIAAAISAYGRIHMTPFLTNPLHGLNKAFLWIAIFL